MAGLLVAVGLSAASPAGASPSGTSTALPGAVADGAVDTLIHTDQLLLVSRAPDDAVAAARGHLDRMERVLLTDGRNLAQARVLVADAGRVEAKAASTATEAAVALGAAVVAARRARAAVATDGRQLQALALGWYTGGADVSPSSSAPLATSQAAGVADTELELLTGLTSANLERDTTIETRTRTAVRRTTARLQEGRRVLATDRHDADHAAAAVSSAARVVAAGNAAVRSASTVLAADLTARARVVATFDGPEDRSANPTPSILGPTAMTAGEITAWFESQGDAVDTPATIQQLASWYVSEGTAEGVRGDIAFAQAMVETGGFDSPDAIDRNNYAGIGHCDNCAAGFRFPSPQAGVRGQIQLLRTYADPTLTTAELASPPPLAVLDPQDQAVRGCCPTWNSLTGVWASDGHYGATVLDVYAELLAFAVAEEPSTTAAG
jgi:hypothetical protein